MLRDETIRTLTGDLSGHRAVLAWTQLGDPCTRPRSITVLKEPLSDRERKPAVYRLDGAGPSGEGVIAKRDFSSLAATERTVYERILPHIPVPGLGYYGSIDEQEGEFSWVFVQDAGQHAYMRHDPVHRAAAATWLGTVHVAAQRIEAAQGLPRRGLAYYQDNLHTACGLIRAYLDRARGPLPEREALQNILAYAGHLELSWGRLQHLCDALPTTLVHGDFVTQNIRLRVDPDGTAVLPFDWGWSGWGTPIVDLAQSVPGSTHAANPDLATYWKVVRRNWPGLQLRTLEQSAQAGTVLRLLNAIYWAALDLPYEWVEYPVSCLVIYEARLAEAIRALGTEPQEQ
jgi:hypothetical protein